MPATDNVSSSGPDSALESFASEQLNHAQQMHLRVSCQHMDKLLSDVEEILHSSLSKSPFPRYRLDLTPAQIRVVEDHIRRFRAQLLKALAWQKIVPPTPDIPATRAISAHLAFVDIALDELRPKVMRGSGALSPEASRELSGVVHELKALGDHMSGYVNRELHYSLKDRLKQVNASGQGASTLQTIEEVVTSFGLVEFRPAVERLIDRLQDTMFEVALFGRVSSGKSSLLNALLGIDVLPVGINPITAVPTRIRHGGKLRALVSTGGSVRELPIGDFAGMVSERSNPGNLQSVSEAIIEVPSDRLMDGIVLVDTPGLGSLARRGAAETLAYLPSCDLALLLIDAGSTVNEEDIGTMRLILEARIEPLVLLSKSDLLNDADLKRAVDYIRAEVSEELHFEVSVHPISALPFHAEMRNVFFYLELLPRFQAGRVLRQQSLDRKIDSLREDLRDSLSRQLDRQKHIQSPTPLDGESMEAKIRDMSRQVGELDSWLDHEITLIQGSALAILTELATSLAERRSATSSRLVAPSEISEIIQDRVNDRLMPVVRMVQATSHDAVEKLRDIARVLAKREAPSVEELESLIRNMPRFEASSLSSGVDVSGWNVLGICPTRSRIRKKLREQLLPALENELSAFTQALFSWARQLAESLKSTVHSYADIYRLELQESSTVSESIDPGELTSAIQRLDGMVSGQPVTQS